MGKLYQDERSPKAITFSFTKHRVQGHAGYDTYRKRNNLQYAYVSGEARTKVRFAGEQHGNRKDPHDCLWSDLKSFGASDR